MEEYLSHHGILGMKWGIRRYQNSDGTLTTAGKARYAKVATDPHLQKKQTKTAIKYYKKLSNFSEAAASIATSDVNKYNRKLEKDPSNEKYKSNLEKSKTIREANEKIKAVADLRLEQIGSGEFKAGRDFIVQNDWNLGLTSIYKEVRIVERD